MICFRVLVPVSVSSSMFSRCSSSACSMSGSVSSMFLRVWAVLSCPIVIAIGFPVVVGVCWFGSGWCM